jgi:hypothetical protein
MRRKVTTPQPPLFDLKRPVTNHWNWTVTYSVASSGYATECHVIAHGGTGLDQYHGSAWCEVSLGDDLREVIECLAIESMLAASEPTLDGSLPRRRIVFSTNL